MKQKLTVSLLVATTLWTTSLQTEGNASALPNRFVEVHTGATEAYKILSRVSANTDFLILDEFTNATGELWYQVQLNGKQRGWVNSQPLSSRYIKVMKKDIVRTGASPLYKTVTTVIPGTYVKIIDSFTNKSGETWQRVTLNGQIGWLHNSSLLFSDAMATTEVESDFVSNPSTSETTEQTTPSAELTSARFVSSNNAVLRSDATSSAPVVGYALLNELVYISQSVSVDGMNWVEITKEDGSRGWIAADTLQETAVLNQVLFVKASSANIRQEPSMTATVIKKATKGTVILALEERFTETGDHWYRVLFPNNDTGWIHSSIVSSSTVTFSESRYVTTKGASYYTGSSFTAKAIGKLAYQTKVTATKEYYNKALGETWVQIKTSSGKTGWIPSFDLSQVAKQTLSSFYAVDAVSLKKEAKATSTPVTSVKAGDKLSLLLLARGWALVETASGVRGYVESNSLTELSPKHLLTPTVIEEVDHSLLHWKKSRDFSFTYSLLSGNRVKLNGLGNIALPEIYPVGVERIEVTKVSNSENALTLSVMPGYTFTIRNHKDGVSIKVMPTGLVGKHIVIDAGHGGKDPGAVGSKKLYEKTVTMETAKMLKAELEAAGAYVTMTRETDIFLELSERTTIANESDADAFISIHTDSYNKTSKGTTTFYNTSVSFNGPKSAKLASIVQKNLASDLGTSDRGTKNQSLYVNRYNELPSILVELAFISNPTEEAKLKTAAFRQKAAASIRESLELYFNQF